MKDRKLTSSLTTTIFTRLTVSFQYDHIWFSTLYIDTVTPKTALALRCTYNKMGSEHILSTNDKNTAEFVKTLGCKEVPLRKVRRKIGWYKAAKAVRALEDLAKEASQSLQDSAAEALSMIDDSLKALDQDTVASLKTAAEKAEVEVVQVFKKKHEGKMVDHVRLNPDVEICSKEDSSTTTFKIKK
ncbi:hypothetical protein D1BOALGB6SA_1044 [Olavius sp. associated proteobacterium Delta 1]|nr:hypothetical protein D1BOALGB6SA_1044 [Olavius sp. associated proteobacterium Delta 1]